MKLLLDTQILLWAAGVPGRLSTAARRTIENRDNEPWFSVASLWEVAIKRSLGRADFRADPRALRRGLLENGYTELQIAGEHASAVDALPWLHRDPFDRMLVAQALVEGITLVTADPQVARYPGSIRQV